MALPMRSRIALAAFLASEKKDWAHAVEVTGVKLD